VEARRQALVADRQVLLAHDSAQEGTAQRRWLYGIDQLETASYDVLTAPISYPAV
jgi:hypothetical protein